MGSLGWPEREKASALLPLLPSCSLTSSHLAPEISKLLASRQISLAATPSYANCANPGGKPSPFLRVADSTCAACFSVIVRPFLVAVPVFDELISLTNAYCNMGRCCVPNCRGNYDNGPKVRLFSFPRDVKRRAEWQRAVRRRDVDVRLWKDPKVCERHFKPEHLRTTSTYTDCNGRTIEAPMKSTRLTPDAFPAIFPDCPSYISDARK
uniref:Putative transposable element n=1 Tax=Ixodes ricinus TaxID=34613 RepID=A0A6B0V2C3_IXORI